MTFDQAISYAIDVIPHLKKQMETIKRRRIDGARDMEGIGRIGLELPDPLYGLVIAYHPDLESPDRETNAKAWLKFMKHPDSERFRVNTKL